MQSELLNPSQFIDLLERLSSGEQDVHKNAESELGIFKSVDIFQYLNFLVLTIGSEEVSPKIKQIALILVKNFIIPSSSNPIAEIKKNWFDERFAVNRNSLKDMLIFIIKENDVLYNYACFLIAAVYQIEEKEWPELFPYFAQILDSPESTHHDIESVYQTFTEIFFMYDDKLMRRVTRENADAINSLIRSILAILQCNLYEVGIREKAALLLKRMLEKISEFPFFNGYDQISTILAAYTQIMPISETKVFEIMYDILVLIVKNYESNLEVIGKQIGVYGMQGFSCNTPELKCITINFWNSILEKKNAPPYIVADKGELVAQLESMLVPAEDDPEFEVPFCASKCFGTFSVLLKDELLGMVGEAVQGMLNNPDWRLVYAAMLAVRGLIQYHGSLNMQKFIECIIQSIVNYFTSENAELAKIAIAVTTEIVTNYPKLVQESDDLLNVSFEFAKISKENTSEQFTYALSLLSKVIKHSNRIFINNKYREIYAFMKELLYAEGIEDQRLELYIFDTFEELIRRATPDFYDLIYPQVTEFLDYILSVLSGNSQSEEKPFLFKLQNICYAIKEVVINVNLPDEAFPDIIGKLFILMNNYGVILSEDIFRILCSIIDKLKENKGFAPYADSFMHFLELALNSDIPSLIGVATEAYGIMLESFGEDGSRYANFLTTVVTIFKEKALPSLTNVYNQILRGIGRSIAGLKTSFPSELIDVIMGEIFNLIDARIDPRNEGEIETLSEIIPFILFVIEKIYDSFVSDDVTPFLNFAKAKLFRNLFKKIFEFEMTSDDVLYSFVRCLDAINRTLGNKVNHLMQLNHVKGLLKLCNNSENTKIRDFSCKKFLD